MVPRYRTNIVDDMAYNNDLFSFFTAFLILQELKRRNPKFVFLTIHDISVAMAGHLEERWQSISSEKALELCSELEEATTPAARLNLKQKYERALDLCYHPKCGFHYVQTVSKLAKAVEDVYMVDFAQDLCFVGYGRALQLLEINQEHLGLCVYRAVFQVAFNEAYKNSKRWFGNPETGPIIEFVNNTKDRKNKVSTTTYFEFSVYFTSHGNLLISENFYYPEVFDNENIKEVVF